MLLRTHLVIAVLALLLFVQYVEHKIIFVLVLIFTTALPDIDTGFSTLGKRTPSFIVRFFTKHRGVLHSFTFCILISFLSAFFIPSIALPFFLSYSLHLFGDSFTKEGIAPFWPSKKRTSGKIRTGGVIEKSVFTFFIILDAAVLVVLLL